MALRPPEAEGKKAGRKGIFRMNKAGERIGLPLLYIATVLLLDKVSD